MKRLAIIGLLAFGNAAADYSESRVLSADVDGIEALMIDAGAGNLEVTGSDETSTIVVDAVIRVSGLSDEKAKQHIQKRLQLGLTRDGKRARLTARFNEGLMKMRQRGEVDLEVRMPRGMDLRIDDGAGSIVIRDVSGSVEIDDGSGALLVQNTGTLRIDDGSGAIEISDVSGDVLVTDGSGSLRVRNVDGNLMIEDGSGDIIIDGVSGDLIIMSDGSGSLSFDNVQGRVEKRDN